ncbi:hypothetical protein H5410_032553 [Solanum commersonii]|uniref:Uncharacterized protein n=1 Tax=Solanum commersonii TaxID=4109 RepID=A0A9J5YN71_SOLCO|nr:hypothetical protein H5410_032553 [Solanum commersonii]
MNNYERRLSSIFDMMIARDDLFNVFFKVIGTTLMMLFKWEFSTSSTHLFSQNYLKHLSLLTTS